ncbi:RNA polymerase factor sigma-54 [Pseudomaricurvus alcaniphilus]|uniref:RNA polymerase factor sigma-54 n=1 Tax=Pseudomaricurvus alcaniphilus TaxID=1166482 RepID=UPI00140E7DAF|nr:RNA polymerase factor sigma-54 [Pseudomaricurvus alcaniphilus]NHN39669.1 RNA polymerase factor sigma-54 [Pseudomaricurvus alcaniphilus]
MKQSLQLKLGQQLTMTPQLQQAIRLLQLSTLDLQAEIQEALDSNPMLEITDEEHGDGEQANGSNGAEDSGATTTGDSQALNSAESDDIRARNESADNSNDSTSTDSDWSDSIPEDLPVDTSWDDIYQTAPSGTGLAAPEQDDADYDSRRSANDSLQGHLMWQLNLTPMSDRDQVIAMAIIDGIEDSGLLGTSLDEIFEGLATELDDLELDEVVAVLHRIQQFDPPGVAARDLSDCLLIQLRQLPANTPALGDAKLIVSQYLALLGSRDYKQLMRKAKLKESELRNAIALIQALNPRPGDQIYSGETEYIVPDVFVAKQEGRWVVNLNPDIAPKIRINDTYASMVKRADTSSDNTFLRDNLQEARWFLKSLQSRNETLLKVATCIVEKQRGFLDFGAEGMKPLVLHDVAEVVGMHESTISRVTTQKFMHTPQGIFELKYFFSSHVSTDSGGECSSTAIRAIIKKLVAAENARKPLSDSKITTLLADQGIKVARRTIAKYRESLGIPASNERKRLV